jgi:siroheme decarboxylase
MTATQQLDALDKRILDVIQSDYPIAPRPYAVVGERLGLTETEVLARVRAMRQKGIIRRLGASFQSRKLGWRSTLCAASVPEEQVEAFAAAVNRHPGVTHNYLRAHRFNVWFTFIGPSWEAVCETLDSISQETGIWILNLPAEKMFKIKVDFQMEE